MERNKTKVYCRYVEKINPPIFLELRHICLYGLSKTTAIAYLFREPIRVSESSALRLEL